MSSSAPVVHLEEFVSRRAAREQGDKVPADATQETPIRSGAPVSAPTRTRAPGVGRRRPARPDLVRSCAGRVAPPARSVGTRVELTRRGRIAVVVLVLVFVTAGVTALGALTPPAGGGRGIAETGSSATTTITVQPGQTLWEIAARMSPDVDIRTTVDEIARLNGLSSAGDVEVGQRLVVPERLSR